MQREFCQASIRASGSQQMEQPREMRHVTRGQDVAVLPLERLLHHPGIVIGLEAARGAELRQGVEDPAADLGRLPRP
jgi:hypothetical protein